MIVVFPSYLHAHPLLGQGVCLVTNIYAALNIIDPDGAGIVKWKHYHSSGNELFTIFHYDGR